MRMLRLEGINFLILQCQSVQGCIIRMLHLRHMLHSQESLGIPRVPIKHFFTEKMLSPSCGVLYTPVGMRLALQLLDDSINLSCL